MPEPRVITFEKDIEEEIRSKAASLSDIASASGFVTNKPPEKQSRPTVFLLLSVIMLFVLAGIGGAFYYLYVIKKNSTVVTSPAPQQQNQGNKPPLSTEVRATSTDTVPKTNASGTASVTVIPKGVDRESTSTKRLVKTPFAELFPLTSPFVESQVTKVETVSNSYILTFGGYSEMFKKINDHESELHDDLTSLFGNATSSQASTASSTRTFKDTLIGSVDAREMMLPGTTEKVYYAFVKPSTLIISEDKKTLEEIAGAILK